MEDRNKRRIAYSFGGLSISPGSPLQNKALPNVSIPTEEDMEDQDDPTSMEEEEIQDNLTRSEVEDSDTESDEPSEEEEEEEPEEEDTSGDPEEDQEEEEEEVNIYHGLAMQAKADNLLPSNFEVPEDIDAYGFYNALTSSVREQEAENARQEVLDQFKSEGVDEQTIRKLYLLRQGYSEEQLSAAYQFENLANSPDEADEDTMKAVIKAYHKSRNYSDSDSNRIVSNLSEDELSQEYNQSRKYFKNAKDQLEKREQLAYQKQKKQEQVILDRNKRLINSITTDYKIGNTPITKEQAKNIHNALHKKTEQFEFQGNMYDATPYQVFDHKLNNDLEFRLTMFNQFLHRDTEMENIKQNVKEEVEKEYLKGLPKRPVVRKTKKKAIKNDQKSSPVSTSTTRRKVAEFGPR